MHPKQTTAVPETISVSSFKSRSYPSVRSSFTKIPLKHNLVHKTGIPLSINIVLQNYQEKLPLTSENEVIRCDFCKSYINPFTEIISPGLQWKCNLCYTINNAKIPFDKINSQYDSSQFHNNNIIQTNNTNKNLFNVEQNYLTNINCYNMVELNNLSYELHAAPQYVLKSPPQQIYVFLIEVSYISIKNKIFSTVMDILLNCVEDSNKKRANFCFVFYNTQVFVLKKNNSLLILNDLDEIPSLFTDDILFTHQELGLYINEPNNIHTNIKDNKESKFNPEIIKEHFENDFIKGSDFAGAVITAKKILQKTGGTIISFLSSLPDTGKGVIEKNNNFYKEIASELSQFAISLSYFLFPQTNIELQTLNILSKFTGGSLNYYPNYNGNDLYFTTKLADDLNSFFDLSVGSDAICRIRANKGINIINYYGNFHQKKHELLSFSNFNPSHSITIECEVNDIHSNSICFQAAMLRTINGKKMIKILNFNIPVDEQNSVYTNLDVNMISHFMAISSTVKSQNGCEYKNGIDYVNKNTRNIIKKYKDFTNQVNGLFLPPSLHALPLLSLSICKSIVLRPSNYTPMDYRLFYSYLLLNAYSRTVDFILYPVLLPLHEILCIDTPIDDLLVYAVNLSLDFLEVDGFYLLDTGATIFFFIGFESHRTAPDQVIDPEIQTGRFILERYDNEMSNKINEIVSKLRENRHLNPNFIVVRDTENTNIFKDIFFSYFVEDKSHSLEGINGYLQMLRNDK
ncbi:COPII subunit [Conglomerata obtusa]